MGQLTEQFYQDDRYVNLLDTPENIKIAFLGLCVNEEGVLEVHRYEYINNTKMIESFRLKGVEMVRVGTQPVHPQDSLNDSRRFYTEIIEG